MVGALARVNTNYDQLHPKAKRVAETLGLRVPCYNSFMNNIAQIVECVHCTETAVETLETLIERGLSPEPIEVKPREGRGLSKCPEASSSTTTPMTSRAISSRPIA